MTPNIEYPYMPQDRHLKYVPAENKFMQEAKLARQECAGDTLFPVGIVLVKDGEVIVRAGNGFNRGPGKKHVCPRIVHECPSGTGYDLCSLHDSEGHVEPMSVQVAKEQGVDIEGADAYMYGHWWACEPCWNALIDVGIKDLYVTEDAHEQFSRERVFAETLSPSVNSAYIAGGITNIPSDEFEVQKKLYECFGDVCREFSIDVLIPHIHNGENQKNQSEKDPMQVYRWSTDAVRKSDVVIAEVSYPSLGTGGELEVAVQEDMPVVLLSKQGSKVSGYTRGMPNVAYHVEYESIEDAQRKLRNILKQL